MGLMASLISNVYHLSYYSPQCINCINLVPHVSNVYLNDPYLKKKSLKMKRLQIKISKNKKFIEFHV